MSDSSPFRESKCIFYVDAEVPDRALNLRVPKQDLNGSQVSRLLVDDGRLGPPERGRPVILPTQAHAGHPLAYKPGILPGADPMSARGPRATYRLALELFGFGERRNRPR